MYFYQLGYSSYEESDSVSLSHEKKFSKEEFNNFFIEATLELLLNRRDRHVQLETEEGEIRNRDFCLKLLEKNSNDFKLEENETKEDFIEKHGHRYWSRFNYIFRDVVEIMIEKYDFKKIKYTQSSFVDGWGKIVKKERSFEKKDLVLNKIREEYWKRKKKKE